MGGAIRAFVAIDPSEAAGAALEAVQEQLRVGRLSDPDTFHVTLAFLGSQPPAVLEALCDELDAIDLSPFSLQLRGLGTFGSASPRAIWAGLVPQPLLSHLHDRVRAAARRAGVDLPRVRFRPHVTLARLGERLAPGDLDRLRAFLERFETFPSPSFEVTHFTLYEFILRREGPLHAPLADFQLATPERSTELT